MIRFSYTAEKGAGEVYKGVAEAEDRFQLYEIVRKEGGRIVSVSEAGSHSALDVSYWTSRFGGIKEHDKIMLTRNMGAMLSAGLALARALAVLERQTKNPRLASVVASVAADVRRGDTLHSALEKYPRVFSKLFISMVRAGEEGGDLPGALKVVADQLEQMYQLKKKIKGAMIYPMIVLIAIFGIGTIMMIKVVPTLANTFKEMHADLPLPTQIIIGISDFLVRYTILFGIGVVLVGVGVAMALRTDFGQRLRDYLLLHTPIIGGMVREVNAARTARTLSSLLSAGVDVLGSLEITAEVVQNSFFKAVIYEAKKGTGAGEPLSVSFARREDLYPPLVGEMIAVGEETGQLSEMLKRVALFYEDEVDRKTRDMSTIIEPFLMLVIGGGVGFFAVSMIMPIYSISQNIK